MGMELFWTSSRTRSTRIRLAKCIFYLNDSKMFWVCFRSRCQKVSKYSCPQCKCLTCSLSCYKVSFTRFDSDIPMISLLLFVYLLLLVHLFVYFYFLFVSFFTYYFFTSFFLFLYLLLISLLISLLITYL